MKIIHTADLHIDSPMTARLPRNKIRDRRAELVANFGRLVGEARRVGARAIIIAGDLFDSAAVRKTSISAVRDAIKGAPDIAFFYVSGNHDAGALEGTELSTLENFYTFPENEWRCYGLGEGVTVTGRLTCSEGMFDSLRLDKSNKNIVILHGELRDRSAAPETVGGIDAREKNIDYLALGHYHTYSATQIDARAVAVYSGSPEGRGFDEAGELGFVLIDTDAQPLAHRFVPFARRAIHIVELDLNDICDSQEIILAAERLLRRIPSEDIVRLVLTGHYTLGLWRDTSAILDRYSDRFYYFEIKDSSRISVRPEDYKNDKSLKGEFIRMILADESLTEPEREKIIACGISALIDEDYEG